MYVWTGKHVPFSQRKIAIKLARDLWDKGYDYTDCDINPICPLKSECDFHMHLILQFKLYKESFIAVLLSVLLVNAK